MKIETLFPLNFSDSILSDVWSCELKFFRKHCQRWISGNKSHHLIAGVHFAKACELVRQKFYNDGWDFQDAIDFGETFIFEAEDTGDNVKSNERLAYALTRYFKKFPLENDFKPVALSDGTHAIEYKFLFDLGIPHPDIEGQNICFTGKLDALYELNYPGREKEIFILDEKTTGRVSRIAGGKGIDYDKEKDKFRTKGQMAAYVWAAQQLGVKVDKALIRRVPLLSKHEDAFELQIPVTPYMIEQWSWTTKNKILELVDKYKWYKENGGILQQSFYPTYQDSCTAYDYLCPFAQGCISKDGEEYIKSTHRQSIYDSETEQEYSLIDYKKLKGII